MKNNLDKTNIDINNNSEINIHKNRLNIKYNNKTNNIETKKKNWIFW